jgi:hypothetical protein
MNNKAIADSIIALVKISQEQGKLMEQEVGVTHSNWIEIANMGADCIQILEGLGVPMLEAIDDFDKAMKDSDATLH